MTDADAVGTFRHALQNSRYARVLATFWVGVGACVTIFGAIGGPFFFDTSLVPDERAEAIASFRPMFMGFGIFFMAMFGGMLLLVTRAQKATAALAPRGDRRRDPLAWMEFVARLNAGAWHGPINERTFEIEQMRRPQATPGTCITIVVNAATRVTWTRRAAPGRMDQAAGLVHEDGVRHDFPGLEVSMTDAAWATRLFGTGGVRAAVAQLTRDQETVDLILRPQRLSLYFPCGSSLKIDADRLRTWTGALASLAEAIEKNGPPARALEPDRLERLMDRRMTP